MRLTSPAGFGRRQFLALLAASASTTPAWAAFPDKPVRMIVPFPAGGAADVMARTLGMQLSEALGQ